MPEVITLKAPIGGINSRESRVDLDPRYSVLTQNMVVERGVLTPRRPITAAQFYNNSPGGDFYFLIPMIKDNGDIVHAGMTDEGEVWEGDGDTGFTLDADRFIADLGVSLTTMPIYTVFNGTTLLAYNGAAPRQFDSPNDTVTTLSFTGVTATELAGCHSFKSRVYWWRANDDSFWYTAIGAPAGTVTEFPLSSISRTGGKILRILSLSRDGGSGPDDYLSIFLTTGEILVYQGSNPGDANDWAIVGRYTAPQAVSARSYANVGGDIIYLTARGLMSVQSVMSNNGFEPMSGPLGMINDDLQNQLKKQRNAFLPNLTSVTFAPSSGLLFVFLTPDTSDNYSARGVYVFDVDSQDWSEWTLPRVTIGQSFFYCIEDASEDISADKTNIVFACGARNKPSGLQNFIGVYDNETNPSFIGDVSESDPRDIECLIRWGVFDMGGEVTAQEFRVNFYSPGGGNFGTRFFRIAPDNVFSTTPLNFQQWEGEADVESWDNKWASLGVQARYMQPEIEFEYRWQDNNLASRPADELVSIEIKVEKGGDL